MRQLNAFCLFVLLGCGLAVADESPVPLLGHNLTPTSYTLREKQLTLGYYAVAYGITDKWTVGMSPWLLLAYNMPDLSVKYGTEWKELASRLGFDFNYLHTVPMLRNRYTQESIYTRWIATHAFDDFYSIHVCSGFQYFFNDERPFSLRLLPGKDTRTTLSLSTLHELHLLPWLGGFLEAGLLGVNYSSPYLHLGASLFARWGWGYVQVGLSHSSSIGTILEDGSPVRVTSTHPEMQVQFFL